MPQGAISYLNEEARLAKIKIDSDIRFQAGNMMQFRTLSKPIQSYGKNKGSQVEIEKYQKLSQATSTISELQSLPMQKPSVGFVVATVNEYGNGVSYTRKAQTLAEYSVDETLKKILSMNVAESMDKIAGTEFQNSDVFYTPTSTTAGTLDKDGTVSTGAGASITSAHIRDIIRNLKTDNVPKWDGNSYLGIFSPFAMAKLFEDTASGSIVDLHKYDQPENLINGEIGQYFGMRMIEENNVLSNTIGGSSHNGEAIVCGFEPVVEVLAQPETTMVESWDFGRFTGVAWNALTGFKKVWTNSTDGEYHMLRIHSND
jgi:N4-gp56 family major capsid protein